VKVSVEFRLPRRDFRQKTHRGKEKEKKPLCAKIITKHCAITPEVYVVFSVQSSLEKIRVFFLSRN